MNLLGTFLLASCFCACAWGFVVPKTAAGKPRGWNFTTPSSQVKSNILNRSTKSIRYHLSSDGYSPTNTAAELDTLRNAFAQWQAIPGTHLRFEDAGLIAPGVDINTADGTNLVYWTKSTTVVNGGRDDMSGTLALTYTKYTAENEIIEADIVFNGHDYQWFTDSSDSANTNYFVEAIALHEIGHFLGLNHSPLGGATMLQRGARGLNTQASLSTDEIAFAKSRYGTTGLADTLSGITGVVSLAGVPQYGAVVIAYDAHGRAVSGTVTITGGSYELPGLPPGNYSVQCTPLDPSNLANRLVQGADISGEYSTPDTQFLPSSPVSVTALAGATSTLNIPVQAGNPVRFAGIRPATTTPNFFSFRNTPAVLQVGQSNQTIGIYSTGLSPTAVLQISGDGISFGPTTYTASPFGSSLRLVSITLSVDATAEPGMRSFMVTQNGETTYGNGFLDIQPLTRDDNYDGLNDAFQRKYFSLWTGANAAPEADPDHDGFSNLQEYVAGTVPTNASSLLRIESIRQTLSDTTITWQSGAGSKYHVLSQSDLAPASWQTNATVNGREGLTTYTESSGGGLTKFYRVVAIP